MAIEGLDVVGSSAISIEVGLTLDVGDINLVDKVLKLGEVEDGTSLPIEDLYVVRSGTISVEIGLTLDVGNINFVDEVHEEHSSWLSWLG